MKQNTDQTQRLDWLKLSDKFRESLTRLIQQCAGDDQPSYLNSNAIKQHAGAYLIMLNQADFLACQNEQTAQAATWALMFGSKYHEMVKELKLAPDAVPGRAVRLAGTNGENSYGTKEKREKRYADWRADIDRQVLEKGLSYNSAVKNLSARLKKQGEKYCEESTIKAHTHNPNPRKTTAKILG